MPPKKLSEYEQGHEAGSRAWKVGSTYVHPVDTRYHYKWRDGYAAGWHSRAKDAVSGAGE